MSDDENDLKAKAGAHPAMSADDRAALWWLARWIGIPLTLVFALYYGEFLFQGRRVDVVDSVLHQEVHPYPFGTNVPPTSLAPPEIPRREPPPPPPPPPAPEAPVSSAEIAASPLEQPQPAYPRRALEAEREGTVRLRITIAPDGSVADAVVVDARPKGWFESAALGAVKRWRYRPSGRTISTEVEIEFKLK